MDVLIKKTEEGKGSNARPASGIEISSSTDNEGAGEEHQDPLAVGNNKSVENIQPVSGEKFITTQDGKQLKAVGIIDGGTKGQRFVVEGGGVYGADGQPVDINPVQHQQQKTQKLVMMQLLQQEAMEVAVRLLKYLILPV